VDGSSHFQAFVVSQHNGVWGAGEEVRGTAALNTKGPGELTSVSCAAEGSCSAGGYYTNRSGTQAFVVSETPAGSS
jgi:hypothetical protein